MRKVTTSIIQGAGAVALACSLALAGCTTNHYPGNGQPYTGGPSVGPALPSSTPGTSSGTNGTPPMSSSSLTRSDAAEVMALHQRANPVYLGPAYPGSSVATVTNQQPQWVANPTGQFTYPASVANPISTVNSSISSAPTPVITTGGEDAFVGVPVGTTGAATSGLNTSAATVVSNGTIVTPTSALTTPPVGAFASGPAAGSTVAVGSGTTSAATMTNNSTGTLTPTVSSGANPAVTAASNPSANTVSRSNTVATTANAPLVTTGVNSPVVTTGATTVGTTRGVVISPVTNTNVSTNGPTMGRIILNAGTPVVGMASSATDTGAQSATVPVTQSATGRARIASSAGIVTPVPTGRIRAASTAGAVTTTRGRIVSSSNEPLRVDNVNGTVTVTNVPDNAQRAPRQNMPSSQMEPPQQ